MTTVDSHRRRNRRGQGARLREDLLDAAEAMLTETGDPTVLTLRSVAVRVGIAATSVYLHFADIDTLKRALAQRAFTAFTAAREAAVADLTEPGPILIAGCQAYLRFALDHPGLYRLMFGPTLDSLTDDTPTDETAPSQSALTALADRIHHCQQTGAAPTDTDPTHLALLVWTSLHGQAMLRIDRPHTPWPPPNPTITDLITRLIQLKN